MTEDEANAVPSFGCILDRLEQHGGVDLAIARLSKDAYTEGEPISRDMLLKIYQRAVEVFQEEAMENLKTVFDDLVETIKQENNQFVDTNQKGIKS